MKRFIRLLSCLMGVLVACVAVGGEAEYKAAGKRVEQCRAAIEKFSKEGTCDDAAFTAKQKLWKDRLAELKKLDDAVNAQPAVKEAWARFRKVQADIAAAKTPEEKARAKARWNPSFSAACNSSKPFVTPEHAKLKAEVEQLRHELYVTVITRLDHIPAVKALTDAYHAAQADEAATLTAWDKERGWITPLAYLEAQPRPYFKPDQALLPLTRCAFSQPFELCREFADYWGYALGVGGDGYLDEKQIKSLDDPESDIAKTVAWVKAHPRKYKLSVHTNRYDPPPTEDVWTHDAEGHVLNGQAKSYDGTTWSEGMQGVISPEAPDSYWIEAGKGRARCIAEIQKLAPITIVMNGGEWGLGCSGQFAGVWGKDPRIQKAVEEAKAKGLDYYEYIDGKVANSQKLLADEVRKVAPTATYIYYTWSGVGHRNRWGGWRDWGGGGGYKGLRGVSDLVSMESYLDHMNSGSDGGMDLLTHNLNSVGQQLAVGEKLMYNWFWSRDPKVSMRRYRGFLKCIYMLGTIGGNAGQYAGIGSNRDFSKSFPTNAVPDWLKQQIALGHVQALFSHLEDYIRNGDLVDDGQFKHIWSKENPAYELLPKELASVAITNGAIRVLPAGRPVRVIARKHEKKAEWLVEAWTADSKSDDEKCTDATVTLPGAGEVKLEARTCGSTYLVTLNKGQPVAELLDPDPDDPSAAFRPGGKLASP